MKYTRKKGKRVKTKDAYYCDLIKVKIVQKLRYCGEDAPDLCEGCKYRKPFIENRE